MTITKTEKDFDNLTIVVVADFNAPVERVWDLWADPRKLERWWGPPTFPATVEQHELTPGGGVTYYMTGPKGEKYRGWWRIEVVDPPHALEFSDGFSDDDGTPQLDAPVTKNRVTFSETDGATRMELRAVAGSLEQLEQLIEMGAFEGMQESIGQMDALLAESEGEGR